MLREGSPMNYWGSYAACDVQAYVAGDSVLLYCAGACLVCTFFSLHAYMYICMYMHMYT